MDEKAVDRGHPAPTSAAENALLGEVRPISFLDIENQVDLISEMIEHLVDRTNWLAQEEITAIDDWISTQKSAVDACKRFIDERTRKLADFIRLSKNEVQPLNSP